MTTNPDKHPDLALLCAEVARRFDLGAIADCVVLGQSFNMIYRHETASSSGRSLAPTKAEPRCCSPTLRASTPGLDRVGMSIKLGSGSRRRSGRTDRHDWPFNDASGLRFNQLQLPRQDLFSKSK